MPDRLVCCTGSTCQCAGRPCVVAQPTCLLVYGPRSIHPGSGWSKPPSPPPPPEDMRRSALGVHNSHARRRGVDEASDVRGQSGGRGTALRSPWTAGQKMPRSMDLYSGGSNLVRVWAWIFPSRRPWIFPSRRPWIFPSRRGKGPEKWREKCRGFGRGFGADLARIFPYAARIFPLLWFY